MMNAMKGEAPLVVGERAFTLVLDHRALIAAEGAAGIPLAMVMAQASLGFMGALAAMLFGALRTHHPEVTLDEAQALTIDHQAEVDAALSAATKAGFPKAAKDGEGKEGANPPAKPRAGTTSGRSGAKRGSTRTASSRPRRGSSKSSSAAG